MAKGDRVLWGTMKIFLKLKKKTFWWGARLGFELKVSCLVGRHSYCLGYSSSP
jgi:hypothetical protein